MSQWTSLFKKYCLTLKFFFFVLQYLLRAVCFVIFITDVLIKKQHLPRKLYQQDYNEIALGHLWNNIEIYYEIIWCANEFNFNSPAYLLIKLHLMCYYSCSNLIYICCFRYRLSLAKCNRRFNLLFISTV